MFARRVWLLSAGVLLLVSSLFLAASQVNQLERRELEHESPWRSLAALEGQPGSTRISARLTEVTLDAGEEAVFELCSRDQLAKEAWADRLDVMVWQPDTQRLELKIALDAPHLALGKRAPDRSCLTLGGGLVQRGGKYAVDLVWAGKPVLAESQRNVPLKARVLAKRPLNARDALLVLGAALGALLSVLAGFANPEPRHESARRGPIWALAASILASVLTVLATRLPLSGAVGGLVRGLLLAAIQVGIAWAFARLIYKLPRAGLSLYAPERHVGAWLFGAMAAALCLRPMARLALALIPATGEAPIEAFISWPSGALAFAALGMVVPLAEELFFRGLVYGALVPLGRTAAIVVTTLLFAAVHAPQTWGNWGALLAVTVTGAVLTCLRAVSGSALVPAVAHLLYNLTLWSDSFRG
ncbi:MAG: type II CAAX endopeptidase family protein [Myxococcales bacterium]